MIVQIAVEGIVDAAVAKRLLAHKGLEAGPTFGLHGKPHLNARLRAYNAAAMYGPWLVLRDLDRDEDCAPTLLRALLPDPAPLLRLRVAVRAVEAWLLADAERFAEFLGVPLSRLPREPDAELDPKRAVVNLARRSRRREIREEVAPAQGMSAPVGPAYTFHIARFARENWNPASAEARSPSLRRALEAIASWQ